MRRSINWGWGIALGLVLGATAARVDAADSAAVSRDATQNAAPTAVKAEAKPAVANSQSAQAKARLDKLDAEYKERRMANALRRKERLKAARKEAKERAEARARAENPPEVKVFVSDEPSPSEKRQSSPSR